MSADMAYIAPELFPRDEPRILMAQRRGWWIASMRPTPGNRMRVDYAFSNGSIVTQYFNYGQWTRIELSNVGNMLARRIRGNEGSYA